MSTIRSGRLEVLWSIIHQSAETDHSKPVDAVTVTRKFGTVTNGVGAQQGNQHWHDERTIADAANDDLDFSGSLVNRFGETIALTAIKAIMIANQDINTHLVIGQAAANPITSLFNGNDHVVKIPPAAAAGNPSIWFMTATDAAGFAVVGGSADVLRVAHGGVGTVSATYSIFVLGVE